MNIKHWTILLLSVLISGCTSYSVVPGSSVTSDPLILPNLGSAPELTNEVWLNTDQPLRLESLRGRVVLLEMWTYG